MKKSLKTAIFGAMLSAVTLFLVSQNVLADSKVASVKAQIKEELMLTLSSNSMNFELNTPELHTSNIDVTGKTNSVNGYTISFNVNNDYNDLKHLNPLVEAVIPSVVTNVSESDFPETAWGYSLDVSNYSFKRIPTVPKNIFTTTTNGESTNGFTVGVRATNVVAGEYENELLFTIVANPDINQTTNETIVYDDKAKAILGTDNSLNLVYDNNSYAVGNSYGSAQIAAVYQVPVNYHPNYKCISSTYCYVDTTRSPWYSSTLSDSNITTVNIDPSFYNFKPTSTSAWFYSMSNLSTLNGAEYINMEQVTNASYMFYQTAINNFNLATWNVENLTNIDYMFDGVQNKKSQDSSLIIDMTGWNTKKIKTAAGAFRNIASKYSSAQFVGLKDWNTNSLENVEYMFNNTLTGVENATLDLSGWDMRRVNSASGMFYRFGDNAKNVTLRLNDWNMENLEAASTMMGYIGSNAYNIDIEMNNLKLLEMKSTYAMFQGTGFIGSSRVVPTSLKISVRDLYAPNLTNAAYMFEYVGHEAEVSEIDVSGWRIENAVSLSRMFNETAMYSSKATINASNWDIHNVKDLEGMFYSCGFRTGDFSLDIRNWQDGNIMSMKTMFNQVGAGPTEDKSEEMVSFEILGLEDLDTSKVTNMSGVFSGVAEYNTEAEFNLDLSGWDMRNVEEVGGMFSHTAENAKSVNVNISGWNFGKTVGGLNNGSIFSYFGNKAKSFNLDLTNWTSVTPINYSTLLTNNVGPTPQYGTSVINY